MGTTYRHGRILSYLDKLFIDRDLNNELVSSREQVALVKNKGKLINVDALSPSQQMTVVRSMNELRITYPDFMVFKSNQCLMNENRTRFAGIPDLIVEVWSPFNSTAEREEKRELFINETSEFWEIEQNSIEILCWRADGTSYKQYLHLPVITPWGEELNLTPLSRDVKDWEPNDIWHGGEDFGKDIEI